VGIIRPFDFSSLGEALQADYNSVANVVKAPYSGQQHQTAGNQHIKQ
jgi:hypothetical protein